MASAMQQWKGKRSTVCPICQNLFRKVTTIKECCHQFCEKCITKKITDEGLRHCPVCNVDLGPAPLQRLRYEARMHELNSADSRWQKTLAEFNKNEIRETGSFLKAKSLKREIYGFDTPETSSRSIKKYDVGNSLKPVKKETIWADSYSTHQSKDLKAVKREEKKPIISTKTVAAAACNNVGKGKGKVTNSFWFSLVASENQRCKPALEQIPSRYLRVKDGNITVSSIKKYLMQKLKLRSENEVEILLHGRPLLPSMKLCNLVDMWLNTSTTPPLQKKTAVVGASASEFVLTLTYSRRPTFA